MALTTYTKKQEELARSQAPVTSSQRYNGMAGVSENTANNLGNYQQGYKPSESVTNYQNQLAQMEAAKPQGYNSKYAPQMDDLLKQITNPEDFKYEFNGDEMFKYYADLYGENARQASMNAMGQAAALTGGYGNSYAQQVGQQAYQEQMRSLYDRGMELQNAAYQRYRDKLAGQQTAYNYLSAADEAAYGRSRDELGDWQNERNYLAGQAAAEREFDYGQYANDLQYWTGLAQVENAAYENEAQRQEAIREYEQNFAEEQRQYDTSLAEKQRQYDQDYAEQVRQYDANLAENQRQADMDMDYKNRSLAENQRQFDIGTEYDYAALEEKKREYDAGLTEEQRQFNQNNAIDWVSAILANGQMPTADLLVQAGLSYEDAQKLIAEIQASGGTSGTRKPTPEVEEDIEPMSYIDARKAITAAMINYGGALPASTLSPSLTGTVADVADKAAKSIAANPNSGINKALNDGKNLIESSTGNKTETLKKKLGK